MQFTMNLDSAIQTPLDHLQRRSCKYMLAAQLVVPPWRHLRQVRRQINAPSSTGSTQQTPGLPAAGPPQHHHLHQGAAATTAATGHRFIDDWHWEGPDAWDPGEMKLKPLTSSDLTTPSSTASTSAAVGRSLGSARQHLSMRLMTGCGHLRSGSGAAGNIGHPVGPWHFVATWPMEECH